MKATIELPDKIRELFTPPRGSLRYRGAKGGRGSAKSFSFAKMAAVWGFIEPLRFLCVRELQSSIRESFLAELKSAIKSEHWLDAAYDYGVDYLRGKNGTEFIFKGLRHNSSSIRSLSKIDVCIMEEAEDVPEYSWEDLEPTIRAENSEMWIIWNPKKKGSPVDRRLVLADLPRSMVVEVNHSDNPWFPKVLEEQRLNARRVMDDAKYQWIWEGKYYEKSDAQIFNDKYRVEDFTPRHDWDGPYYGLDFGFSQSPTAGLKCWIYDRKLYIEYEAGDVGLELDDTAEFLTKRIPGIENHKVRADSARPESISYLKRHGIYLIEGAKKGPGSVEDGIQFIKSFDIVIIHTRCPKTLSEFRLYSYKIDRLSGDIMPDIVDADNHFIDGLRYALEPVMKGGITDYGAIL